MKIATLDVKSLVIGLLLGVCTILAIAAARGEAPQKLDADYRYQVSVVHEDNGTWLYILDHETKKVHRRQYWSMDSRGDYDIKRGIEGH